MARFFLFTILFFFFFYSIQFIQISILAATWNPPVSPSEEVEALLNSERVNIPHFIKEGLPQFLVAPLVVTQFLISHFQFVDQFLNFGKLEENDFFHFLLCQFFVFWKLKFEFAHIVSFRIFQFDGESVEFALQLAVVGLKLFNLVFKIACADDNIFGALPLQQFDQLLFSWQLWF